MKRLWVFLLLAIAAPLSGCQSEISERDGAVPPDLRPPSLGDSFSPTEPPEDIDAPEGWMGQVQASLAASERQPSWQSEGVVLTHRGEGLRGTLSDDGALQVARRTTGGPLAGGALDITLRTSHWGRDGQTRSASLGGPEPGACLPGDKTSDVEGKCIARVALRGADITAWWGSAEAGLQQGWTLEEAPRGSGPVRIEVAISGASAEVDEEAQSATLVGPTGQLRYHGLAAWDATGAPLEAWMEATDDGLAVLVDDAGAEYPVQVDPYLSDTADWTAESNQIDAYFGQSVSSAGDVNGDGFGDVVVGAYYYDNGQGNEGRAFVYLGSPSGLGPTAAWTAESNQLGARFGYSVSSAGDVNGDGYGDVLVGAYKYDNGQGNEGRAFVYLGSPSGLAATAAWTAESNQASAQFGQSVSSAGDVNGDGYGDVLVGAPYYDNSQSNEGRAFVYLGSPSGLAGTAAWTAESDQAGALFGASVSSAGDVNGDGYDDVLVGAYKYDDGEADEGGAFVYLGSLSGLATTAAWTAESNQANSYFGCSVSPAGDVNGDGYGDVLVGAYRYDNGEADEGRAFVYLGSASGLGPAAAAAWTAESNQVDAWFGWSVSSAGDVNGDGYGDVLVGAHYYDNGETDEGGAFVYLGSPSGLTLTAAWTVESNQTSAFFGTSVSSAGDVNGDGYSDVLVGAPYYDNGQLDEGVVFVYLGAESGLEVASAWTAELNQDYVELGASVSSAGDVNGDGYGDVVVGAPYYDNGLVSEGGSFVYLGSSSGLAATAAWTAESNQANAQFGYSVSSAGDVNGDGYGDVLVGAPYYDNGEADEGAAFVYLGSASGLGTTAWTAESNQVGGEFGQSVSPAGDVNGDGYGDVIVGASGYVNGEAAEGGAFVYLGSPSGLAATAAWAAESNQTYAEFGWSVSSAGDVNGDGYGDVLVGAPYYDNGEADEGAAFVYLGSPSGLATAAAWTAESNQANAYFGYSVSSAGDVNGDGYGDVIVGAYGYDNGHTDEGGAFVYLGLSSGLTATAGGIAESNQTDARLGLSVSSAGDVNGDGYGDVIVGAPYYDNAELNEGAAFVYLGSPWGLSGTVAWTAGSNQADARFGNSVSSAGDVNGDGYSDVVVGAPHYDNGHANEGRVFVYLGADGNGSGSGDGDGDGDPVLTDCDDANATIYSGATELCDAIDSDCDGSLVDSFTDTDGDLDPDCIDDDDDSDGFPDGVDCGPLDPSIYPNAPELCDAIDSNCNGSLVDGFTDTDGDLGPDCTDVDDDGDGDPDATDCASLDASIYAGATELCDAIDSDCNGSLVDSFTDTDADLDPDCTDPDDDGDGEPDATDCAALDASIYAGAPELCDAIDSDCDNSLVDSFVDTDGDLDPDCTDPDDDGDGDPDATDCASLDATIYLGAAELCDTIDSDCNGSLVDGFTDTDGDLDPDCTDPDDDGDGDLDATDCADLDASIYTGATELCDAIDSNCDGSLVDSFTDTDGDLDPDCIDGDDDGDLFPDSVDCDPLDASVYPNATELCDATDSDCDGSLVDGFTDTDADLDPDCTDGDDDGDGDPDATDCAGLDASIYSGATELCNGIDDDCNGSADFMELPAGDDDDSAGDDDDSAGDDDDSAGPGFDSTEGDIDGDGYLECGEDCDDQNEDFAPDAAELCDGWDNDCDGLLPDDEGDGDMDGQMECEGDCDDGDADTSLGGKELCDGIDNDCDGTIADEELDGDSDGQTPCDGDCDDDNPGANADAPEVSAEACADGFDNDCDEWTDLEDDDCADFLGDDDDAAGDDDDTAEPSSCEGCESSQGGAPPGGSALYLLLLALLCRRGRHPRRGPARGSSRGR